MGIQPSVPHQQLVSSALSWLRQFRALGFRATGFGGSGLGNRDEGLGLGLWCWSLRIWA